MSALVVVVGISPVTLFVIELLIVLERRRRIASVGGCSQSHRDATIARSAGHNLSTSRIESEAALNPSLVQKNSSKTSLSHSTLARQGRGPRTGRGLAHTKEVLGPLASL